ncbi:Os04g0521000 [Oryza sativa Japonica Group]|uniref:Os04g0521000 protein n=1 Tax=Oryza sativa subsp. japonica TaxID=39947 RepID=C7J1T2_ORYSJ|nr:Os04g0521000 [Oryza sativa Japonica Group]|eukprot:NP_001174020.1 Os04g0521000 [Oryza sativa Japonica Group]
MALRATRPRRTQAVSGASAVAAGVRLITAVELRFLASSSPPASSSTIARQLATRQRISAGGGWRQGGAGGGRRSGCAQAATVAWRHTAGARLATRRRGRRPARRRRDCAWRRPAAWRWLTTWRRTASKPDGYPSGMPVPDGHEHGYSSELKV